MSGENREAIELWNAEYERGGIPSSVRTAPSGAVVWALGELRQQPHAIRTAVDIGCGKGRNSLYLARESIHVTAMDFTPAAIAHLEKTAKAEGLAEKIRALTVDVTEPWPLAPDSADFAVDAFCFKHITPSEARDGYKQSLLQVLRRHGHYLISFASVGDGYYGHYMKKRIDEHEEIVVDPVNGIESALFSRERVVRFFAPELDLFKEIHHNTPSAMHGEVYDRSTYALLFRRSPRYFR